MSAESFDIKKSTKIVSKKSEKLKKPK